MLEPPRTINQQDGTLKLSFHLPIHAISLLVLTPVKEADF
jgi:hypothetical protein